MLKRLEDLNSQTQPSSLKNGAPGEEIVENRDSKLPQLQQVRPTERASQGQ
jgi:hypothetical protein